MCGSCNNGGGEIWALRVRALVRGDEQKVQEFGDKVRELIETSGVAIAADVRIGGPLNQETAEKALAEIVLDAAESQDRGDDLQTNGEGAEQLLREVQAYRHKAQAQRRGLN